MALQDVEFLLFLFLSIFIYTNQLDCPAYFFFLLEKDKYTLQLYFRYNLNTINITNMFQNFNKTLI